MRLFSIDVLNSTTFSASCIFSVTSVFSFFNMKIFILSVSIASPATANGVAMIILEQKILKLTITSKNVVSNIRITVRKQNENNFSPFHKYRHTASPQPVLCSTGDRVVCNVHYRREVWRRKLVKGG